MTFEPPSTKPADPDDWPTWYVHDLTAAQDVLRGARGAADQTGMAQVVRFQEEVVWVFPCPTRRAALTRSIK